MRGLTVASRPGPFLGALGTLLIAFGITTAVAYAVFVVMAVVAERKAPGGLKRRWR